MLANHSNGTHSANVFLVRALEKIIGDKEMKKSYNSQLRKQCETALTEFKNEAKANSETRFIEIDDVEKYFVPFELVLKCRSSKIIETSLDCIQKLVAHGYLFETTKMSPNSTITKQQLIQRLIKTICLCFDGPDIDDSVQLQIIKSLLTILTSPHIEVHEQTLLLPIKTCYNIQISSRSLVNQASARAALTQIINTVLTRLENSYQKRKKREKSERNDSAYLNINQANLDELKNYSRSETVSLNDSTQNEDPDQFTSSNEIMAEGNIPSNLEHCKQNYVDILHTFECEQLNLNLNSSIDDLSKFELSNYEICDLMCSILDSICDEAELTTVHNESVNREEKLVCEEDESQVRQVTKDPEIANIEDLHEIDTYLMFRAFCKLSLRQINPDSNSPDIKNDIDIKSKILSLQLILATLQNAKSSFKESSYMINAIRRYLCVSLSKNGVSPITEVFELSLAIFVALLADYKQHLKKQIEVFFREIVLFLLETPTSPFDHKWLVIQALTHICANAQCVVDLYINYDCDLQSTNIFARLVNVLSKKALGRQTVDLSCSQIQLNSLRLKGLECLVSIVKCMVEWTKDLYTNPNVQSSVGPENRPVDSDSVNASNKIRSYDSCNSLNSSSSNTNASYNPSDFEIIKCKKELWEKGIELFRKKPSKGIQFLQENDLLGHSSHEIAYFFLEDNRLDKTAIGDFLGENEKFNKEVMYAYVDLIDFHGMEIVSALRMFLEKFRLPGEAQKIDRLMEKFAARYHELNKKFANSTCNNATSTQAPLAKNTKNAIRDYYFESADAVYVLAFSIIMLATDLHSASVKKKMTKEAYINMNRGINENKDLPREFLEKIYDQIAESEIKVKPTLNANTNRPKAESEKHRKLLYNMEIEQVTQTARSLMESVYHVPTHFTFAKHGEHIMPMFRLAWTPFLAAFSIALQDSDDQAVVELCLTGIRCSIRISCIFHLELERDAYIQALSKFTLLCSSNNVAELKPKNVDCFKNLITIALTDGNYLGKSWYEILKCISQFEVAQSIGVTVSNVAHTNSSVNLNNSYLSTISIITRESSILKNIIQPSSTSVSTVMMNSIESLESKALANIQIHIGDSLTQSVIVAVDRIFTGSTKLDGDGIVEFVKWLCFVSEDELTYSPPRMYSLQKIVEISYYNMGRIRLQWTRIWNILGEHFNKAGCSSNEEIAFFAIDSLRQLTMKFLEKGEFANFRFQKDFLKPFEHIMKRNSSFSIRDMVLQCIAQMVKSQAQNIKSGWKNVFGVFHLAASQNNERILNYSFDIVTEIIRNYVEKYFMNLIDSFQDAIKCLSEFACNSSSPDISIEAIGHIRNCAVFVAEKPKAFIDQGFDDLKNIPESDLVWMKGWFPILFELSCIINRCKLDVRTRGLTVMFEIMKTYGETFRTQWWKDLFNIVFRIFDNMKLPEAQVEKNEWMTTTCNHALYAIIDVFSQYYETISSILVDELYTHLKWCVKQDNEQLARSGINCLENFVITNGEKFSDEVWRKTCDCLSEIFSSTIPLELLTWTPSLNNTEKNVINFQKSSMMENLKSGYSDNTRTKIPNTNLSVDLENKTFQTFVIKCIVQLELIQTIDNIIFYPTTSKKEDAKFIAAAQALSSPPTYDSNKKFGGEIFFHDQYGMYLHLKNEQLLNLVDCLERSFEFSRKFNCNHEQRNVLWKAGFNGKEKPNLLNHETQSLACILRILFKMFNDESRKEFWSIVQIRLLNVCQSSLDYYSIIDSENHREMWDNLILMMLTKTYKLDSKKFKIFSSFLYRKLCDILSQNLKLEIRNILKEIFIQIGYVNSIQQIS